MHATTLPWRRKPRSPIFEALEARLCLSCTTRVEGTTLFVFGTELPDLVEVCDNGKGLIQVACPADEPKSFRGIERIVVELGGGNDTLSFTRAPGDPSIAELDFDLGVGDDTLTVQADLTDVDNEGLITFWDLNAALDMGAGNDHADVHISTSDNYFERTGARIVAELGEGDDHFDLTARGIIAILIGLRAGEGADTVEVDATGHKPRAQGAPLPNQATLDLGLGAGNDTLSYVLQDFHHFDSEIDAGAGNDAVRTETVSNNETITIGGGRTRVGLGAGDDVLKQIFALPEVDDEVLVVFFSGDGHDTVDLDVGDRVGPFTAQRSRRLNVQGDLGDGNNAFAAQVRNLDDTHFDLTSGAGNDSVLIGMLLPAVQKVREAAARVDCQTGDGLDTIRIDVNGFDKSELGLSTGEGDDQVRVGMLLPAVQKVRDASARIDVALGGGADSFTLNTEGIDDPTLDLTSGDGDDQLLIGMLLPAVQKVRDAAARSSLHLGAGNDVATMSIKGFDLEKTEIVAGSGDDHIHYTLDNRSTGLLVKERGLRVDAGAGNDTVGVQELGLASAAKRGKSSGRTLIGGDGDDTISLAMTGLTLAGGTARPTEQVLIQGDAGNDKIETSLENGLFSGPYSERIFGGAGNDSIRKRHLVTLSSFDARCSSLVDGQSGNDTINVVTKTTKAPNLNPRRFPPVTCVVKGGTGNDAIGLEWVFLATAAPGRPRPLPGPGSLALLDGGRGRDRCKATRNVRVINCES